MDRKWWLRAGLAALVVMFILLIARTTIVGMRPDTAKIDRAVTNATGKGPSDKPAGPR